MQNRVSTRRAAVLAYLGQLLLRTLPAIEHQTKTEDTTIIFDMPRPDRDFDIVPNPALETRRAELVPKSDSTGLPIPDLRHAKENPS